MKNLKTFALLFCSVVTLSAFAVLPESGTAEEEKIQQEIARLLDNPGFVLENAIDANVHFMLNREGEIVVLTVETPDDQVESYIKSRLNYQKLPVPKELLNKKFWVPVHIQIK